MEKRNIFEIQIYLDSDILYLTHIYIFYGKQCDVDDKSPVSPSSPRTEITQLKDQLEAQAQQTRQALGQLMLVREQLISETNARIEAQVSAKQAKIQDTTYSLTLCGSLLSLPLSRSLFIGAHAAAAATESRAARTFGIAGRLQRAADSRSDLCEHWHGPTGESIYPRTIHIHIYISIRIVIPERAKLTGEFMFVCPSCRKQTAL